MTVDELIAMARTCADAGLDECRALASGVIDVLTVDQPCGWDVPVVSPGDNAIVWETIVLDAGEARWVARALLEAVDQLEGGKT